ncbi:uncharacterized protein LOC111628756 [Centruroides sculpturatus]|uniref:uncharacterized protein LOC111628756 n=1 Tax=Centruroides sculpturatus TaxID=218467 RepID=UPI000C6EB6E0|nr:uncharacterized protein LOC111628756 [Centruroides sculpturatus]
MSCFNMYTAFPPCLVYSKDINNGSTSNLQLSKTTTCGPIVCQEPLDFSMKKDNAASNTLSKESLSTESSPSEQSIGQVMDQLTDSLPGPSVVRKRPRSPTSVPLKKYKYFRDYKVQDASPPKVSPPKSSSPKTSSPKICDINEATDNDSSENYMYPQFYPRSKIPPGLSLNPIPSVQMIPDHRNYFMSTQIDALARHSCSPILPSNYIDPKKKHARPFKNYPINGHGINYVPSFPYDISLSLDPITAQTLINNPSNETFQEFRAKQLAQRRQAREKTQKAKSETVNKDSIMSNESAESNESNNGDSRDAQMNPQPSSSTEASTSKNATVRKRSKALPNELKDEAYWERRRKNNEAAKRSRDARRAKEDEIAIKATFLQQENMKLRIEIANLKEETSQLKLLLYGGTPY